MIDHIGLDVSDIVRSRAFYRKALEPLGYRIIQEIQPAPERPPTVVMFGVGDEPDFVIAKDKPPGPGNHVAFRAETRAQVDAFHAAALQAGGRDNGGPGIRRRYSPTYYAAFVFDPDGFNIEAVCHAAG
ncbi:VOC family protein [Brevundimonas sp.]|uniref:VOC family protein n=1 Tax=Brevundimonas sp. TaxID=1871086 RepID=UPI002D685394|nr:VOC family protein [Brevundimonas sp.]HYC98284.1 VOC family protein [Brevundimonas sp.]